jgi:hypothetical protein
MRLLLLLTLILSCTKKEHTISKEELLSMGEKVSADISLVVPTGIATKLVDCSLYRPRCIVGYRVKVKLLEFNALMYNNKADAFLSAQTFEGYYSHNWSFDYVVGEPILERFVKKAYDAKKVTSEVSL